MDYLEQSVWESVREYKDVIETYVFVTELKIVVDTDDGCILVRIRFYLNPFQSRYYFSQSHHIKTPHQMAAYITSKDWDDTLKGAVSRAVSTLLRDFESAVATGHKSSTEWFIPYPSWEK